MFHKNLEHGNTVIEIDITSPQAYGLLIFLLCATLICCLLCVRKYRRLQDPFVSITDKSQDDAPEQGSSDTLSNDFTGTESPIKFLQQTQDNSNFRLNKREVDRMSKRNRGLTHSLAAARREAAMPPMRDFEDEEEVERFYDSDDEALNTAVEVELTPQKGVLKPSTIKHKPTGTGLNTESLSSTEQVKTRMTSPSPSTFKSLARTKATPMQITFHRDGTGRANTQH